MKHVVKVQSRFYKELVTDYLDEVSVEDIIKDVIEESIKDKLDSLLTAFISNVNNC